MSIISKLAFSLDRKDEVPNQELAAGIVKDNNKEAVKELIENLSHKNKNIQNDCIKVLYEIGEKKPALIEGYTDVFTRLLSHKNNRLQWGGMTALQTITPENPEAIYKILPAIIDAADKGSVITNDQCVAILLKLCEDKKYKENVFPLFLDRIRKCPTNQLPMYAENALHIIDKNNQSVFSDILISRIPEIEKESKVKRVEKVLKKAEKV